MQGGRSLNLCLKGSVVSIWLDVIQPSVFKNIYEHLNTGYYCFIVRRTPEAKRPTR